MFDLASCLWLHHTCDNIHYNSTPVCAILPQNITLIPFCTSKCTGKKNLWWHNSYGFSSSSSLWGLMTDSKFIMCCHINTAEWNLFLCAHPNENKGTLIHRNIQENNIWSDALLPSSVLIFPCFPYSAALRGEDSPAKWERQHHVEGGGTQGDAPSIKVKMQFTKH